MLNILFESLKIDVHLKIVIKSKFDTIFLITASSLILRLPYDLLGRG
jgi:hypothetical protein